MKVKLLKAASRISHSSLPFRADLGHNCMTLFGVGHINGMKDSRIAGFIYDMPLLFMIGEAINETVFWSDITGLSI
jgi:hypothetical protein